jgi:tetratricopeptide (TPR) repeat protein
VRTGRSAGSALQVALAIVLTGAAAPEAPAPPAQKTEAPAPAAEKADAAKTDATRTDSAKAEAPAAPPAKKEVVQPATPKMYDEAVAAHGRRDHAEAVVLLYRWLSGAPKSSENYDLVQHLMAEDLADLGLYQAAIAREVAVARNRARPELLPDALVRLRKWSEKVPFDEGRVYGELLHGTDFGSIEGPMAAWVFYQQGVLDLKNGDERWAALRFAQIPPTDPLTYRARLLIAAAHAAQQPDEMLKEFEALAGPTVAARRAALEHLATHDAAIEIDLKAADASIPADVRNDARIQAARLHYDRGEFQEALDQYESLDLPELDPGRGQLYLEQAWTLYRLGFGGRAMGLLAALDAPSFRKLFLPDKYLLRAFIFKDVCQLLTAKSVARGLGRRYRTTLDAIKERRPLTEDPTLVSAALEKGAPRRTAALVTQLKGEREILTGLAGRFSRYGFAKSLGEFYATSIAEAERERQLAIEQGVIEMADALLHDAEQVSLLDYEVGLALYRRDRGGGPTSPLVFEDVTPREGQEAYAFDGEYWNDELLEYRFNLENRCAGGARP